MKILISQRIRAVWTYSSLGSIWIAKDAKFLHADNEEADLSLRMAYISECIFSYVAADRVMGIANGV